MQIPKFHYLGWLIELTAQTKARATVYFPTVISVTVYISCVCRLVTNYFFFFDDMVTNYF